MSDRDWLDSMVVTEAPATLVKRDDLLRLIALARKAMDERDRLRAQEAVRGGEWCAENRAAGRNPCGACRWCCAQAERERDEADKQRWAAIAEKGGALLAAQGVHARAEAAEAELARLRGALFSVGIYKGEMDFRVTATIADLRIDQMSALREMLVVGIGTMEAMWRDEIARRDPPQSALARAESDEKGGAK